MKTSSKAFYSLFRMFLLCTGVAMWPTIGVVGGESRAATQAPVIKSIQSRQPEKIGMSNKDMEKICAAAIATLLNRPTATVKVDSIEKGRIRLSSTLPEDNSVQQYSCGIEKENVLLAREGGPWRTDNSDERITFRLTTDTIHITVAFSDGSDKRRSFPR